MELTNKFPNKKVALTGCWLSSETPSHRRSQQTHR